MPIKRQTSFGSGEFSPSLWSASELEAYGSAARTVRNFFASKYRTLLNRTGTVYCGEVKDSTKLTRLLPFTFSSDQAYPLEFGDLYARVWDAAGNQLKAQGLVALGVGNTVRAKSVDKGANWTQPTAPPGSGSTNYNGACEAGNGRLVAVGITGGTGPACATSDDGGVTWTARTLPGGATVNYAAVAFNGRVLVAAAQTGVVSLAISYDNGDTWQAVASPPSLFCGGGNSLAWGNGRWILVGQNTAGTLARYSTSYDGLTWSAATAVGDLDTGRANGHRLDAVCFLAGQFLAVGQVQVSATNFLWLWARIGVLASNWKWGEVGTSNTNNHHLKGVATDGQRAVAVGWETSVGPAAYMYDPVVETFTSLAPTGSMQLAAVAYSRGYWVAVAGAGTACKRYDGTAWTADPIIASGSYACIAACKGTEIQEVATPYSAALVREIAHVQSGDVLTAFHRYFPPKELKRYGLYDWRLDDWYKTPPTLKVSNLAFAVAPDQVGDANHPPKEWGVVVTWEDEETGVESLPCDPLVPGGNGKYVVYPDRPQGYVWSLIVKARRYHIYRGRNGEWGWIGSAAQPKVAAGAAQPATVSFRDDGQTPLYQDPPPLGTNPFQSDLSYPSCGCYLDDRLVVAGSLVQPATIRGSAVSSYYDFDKILLPGDDASFEFTLSARRFEEIRWLVPMERLIAGTSESEWVAGGGSAGDAPITPSAIFARSRSNRGSSRVQPVVVGDGVVYVQNGGQVLRDFRASRDIITQADTSLWGGVELSMLSQHLLEGYSIVDMAYAKEPHSVIWIVRSDGALLSLTFIREHGVWGWARHDSGGDAFEAVTVVPDGTRDVPFFVVKRTINGVTKRYIERLATRSPADANLAVFLDCATTYSGVAIGVMTGLAYLEGRTVGIVADGSYRGTGVVNAGQVAIPGAQATKVVVGLLITADFESLDYPQGQTQEKIVKEVGLETRLSPATTDPAAGVYVGESSAGLGDIRKFSDAQDGKLVVPVESAWNLGGRCFLRHTMPFALEITAVSRELVR